MSRRRESGSYHAWNSFLRCPDCGSDEVAFEHYDDGTMFNCEQCGAEAWAARLVRTEA
ncbi:hypothetical protein [Halodesulfurarchaeum sp.]|uniref:hypothetical protein n=1 Tax=Halodesulfurarchaeum sp. TaxID=1980530 RepID=UPI001BC12C7F|nr:hypothetical protein [Halodesulfurarchaeum sp.]